MRRMAALFGALVMTLVLGAPAAAAKPFDTYTVAEANCGGVPSREWMAGTTWHARGGLGGFETFVLIGDEWVANGTETWVDFLINANEHAFIGNGKLQVRDSVFGDFDGIWLCNNGSVCGGTLKGLDGAAYGHLTIKVVGQASVDDGLPTTDVCGQDEWGADWYSINTWTLH